MNEPLSLTSRLLAAYKADERRSFDIEIGGETVTIWYRPVTVGEMARLQKATERDSARAMVDLICAKATDKDGNALLPAEHAQALLAGADPRVIGAISNAILGVDRAETAAKN